MSSNGRNRELKPSHVAEDLSAYLDGELDRAGRARVEAHLSTCDSCALELRTLQQTKLLMSKAPRMAAPRRFTIREMDVAPRPQPRMRWGMILARAAAPVVAVMLFMVAAGDVLTHRTLPSAMPAPVSFSGSRQTAGASGTVLEAEATASEGPQTALSLPTPVPTMAEKSVAPTRSALAATAPSRQPTAATVNMAPTAAPTAEPRPTTAPDQASGMGAPPSPPSTDGAPTATPPATMSVGLAAMPTETEVSPEVAARMTEAPPGKGGAPEATATGEPLAMMGASPATATATTPAPAPAPATATLRPPTPTATRVAPTRVAPTSTPTTSARRTATATALKVTAEATGEASLVASDSGSRSADEARSDEGDAAAQATALDNHAIESPLVPSWAWRTAEVVLGCALVGLLLVVFLTARGRA